MSAAVAYVAPAAEREFASFRDPSGHVFRSDGVVYRSVHKNYASQYQLAHKSGLFDKATATNLLIPFEDIGPSATKSGSTDCFTVLRPRQLDVISYPYEWSFNQLKDAARTTLDLHLLALDHGMLLKDANAFNIQFVDCKPALIDHLSFEALSEHPAWPAYGQFCRHFLAPLLLMSYVHPSLARLLQVHIDGIPLDLASSLLPLRTKLRPGVQIHIHSHARMSQKYADTRGAHGAERTARIRRVSPNGHRAIARSLQALIGKLQPSENRTEWDAYYSDTNYSDAAFDAKKTFLQELLLRAAPRTVWDVGGNNGAFSRAMQGSVASILCMDIDPNAVDQNYVRCRQEGTRNILPLIVDLTNPSPGLGFANRERPALFQRSQPDLIVALALIHHLAISNNLPFDYIARLFADLAPGLIIEFVPKSDGQVQRLLLGRRDIFQDYDRDAFVAAFSTFFDIAEARPIPGTDRTLFLMLRKSVAPLFLS